MRLLDERRNIRPEIKSLYRFAGMFELIGKLGREPIPSSFLDPQYRQAWPEVAGRKEVPSDIARVLVERTIQYLRREDCELDLVIGRICDGRISEAREPAAAQEENRHVPPFGLSSPPPDRQCFS